jgi:hypothetical protein
MKLRFLATYWELRIESGKIFKVFFFFFFFSKIWHPKKSKISPFKFAKKKD